MKQYRSHSLALIITCFILAAGIGLIHLSKWLKNNSYQPLKVRTFETVALPPPTPPPASQQEQVELPNISISTPGSGPQIEMNLIQPDIKITAQALNLNVNTSPKNWEESLHIDWQAFSLDHLDATPRLLKKPKYTLPTTLRKRGIKHFEIALDVVIDTKGRVNLVDIRENPYPSFNKEINNLVESARFSSPTKDGQPVKARFIWPIEIGSL